MMKTFKEGDIVASRSWAAEPGNESLYWVGIISRVYDIRENKTYEDCHVDLYIIWHYRRDVIGMFYEDVGMGFNEISVVDIDNEDVLRALKKEMDAGIERWPREHAS